MDTHKNSQRENFPNNDNSENKQTDAPLKKETQEEKQQREWEEAKKFQQENAKRPGVDTDDLTQHDEQGNPKNLGLDS